MFLLFKQTGAVSLVVDLRIPMVTTRSQQRQQGLSSVMSTGNAGPNPTAPIAAPTAAPPAPNPVSSTSGTVPSLSAPVLALPARIVPLPLFTGEPAKGEKRLPISATKHFLDRVNAHFQAYSHQYPNDSLKLNALYGCFPQNSISAIWFGLQHLTFATYSDFVTSFEVEYGPTDTEVIAVEQSFLSFRQREGHPVRQYYNNYTKLLAELSALERVYPDHLIRGNWVNGLRQPIQREVLRIYRREPSLTLPQLLHEAEIEESQSVKPKPRFQGMHGKPKARWTCYFCKSNTHTAQTCPKIAARKEAGTWQERPPPQKR
jgi:hypothetical protein